MALALGKTLGEVDALPYPELMEWGEYFAKHPPPLVRLEVMIAALNATLSNIHRRKGSRARSAMDFAWFLEGSRERSTRMTHPGHMKSYFRMLAALMKGNPKRRS